jgi:hypothetical protein
MVAKNAEYEASVRRAGVNAFVDRDEVDAESTKFFQCIDQLSQTSRKPVVAVNDHRIEQTPATCGHESIECWPSLTRSADSLIHELLDYQKTPTFAEFAQFLQLHFRALSVTCAHPSVQRGPLLFHRLFSTLSFEQQPACVTDAANNHFPLRHGWADKTNSFGENGECFSAFRNRQLGGVKYNEPVPE